MPPDISLCILQRFDAMSTPEISLDEQAEAFKAWKRGEPVEYWKPSQATWKPLDFDRGISLLSTDIVRRKPTPKLRPWKAEEVPVGALWRNTGKSGRALILGVTNSGRVGLACNTTDREWFNMAEMIGGCEYSTDNGKTWKPCGVEETT